MFFVSVNKDVKKELKTGDKNDPMINYRIAFNDSMKFTRNSLLKYCLKSY